MVQGRAHEQKDEAGTVNGKADNFPGIALVGTLGNQEHGSQDAKEGGAEVRGGIEDFIGCMDTCSIA